VIRSTSKTRTNVACIALLSSLTVSGRALAQPHDLSPDDIVVANTVDSVATIIDREYFDAATAARVARLLRSALSEGRYDGVATPESLATMLTHDLFEATQDKHLRVSTVQPSFGSPGSEDAPDSRSIRSRRENFGVRRVEILAGNVGLLDLTAFYRPEEAKETISAAMRVLRSADALILDLRDNGGGSPGTVALFASYLFDTPGLPLFEIVPRSGDRGHGYGTSDPPVPERDGTRPVFVLTSRRTFSAGEGLAFILQEQHRAEIIGEQTAGAANPGRPYLVNALVEVTVPNGQVRTALTGRNWEGTGVTPDLAVPAHAALRQAYIRALRAVLKLATSSSWRDSIETHLANLEAVDER
jgi:hypothetical protein